MYKYMKKLLIIAAVIMCTTFCVYAGSEYIVSDGIITEYCGNEDVVVVPAVIDGIEIAVIDTGTFKNKDMHTVIIEDGIEVIQPKAFVGCSNLRYVKSPDSMLLINENAFFECSPLLQLDVSENTYVMGEDRETDLLTETDSESYNGFLYSGNTITGYIGEETDIIIPDSINDVTITTIAASAFEGNTVITSVTVPDTITTIGAYAFKGCTALAEVSLSKNLSSAGIDIFSGCSSLLSITIPGTLARVSNNMFYGCSALVEVVLESGVNRVGQYAFYQCENLEKIEVPGTITRFDLWAFGFCKKLKTVSIPYGCTKIDTSVFYYCSVLNNIYIPDTITTIGSHCFRACKSLSDITLSKTLETIQNRTFNGCAFTEIEIPDSVTKIGVEAFYQCQKLKNIEIPATITSVGDGTFFGCTALDMLIIYGTDTVMGEIFTYKEDTSMGENTILYVVAESVPEQYAIESSLPHKSMSGTVNVVNTYFSANDTESTAENSTVLTEDDTVYAKYKIINVGDKNQNLRLLICLYDEEGRFMEIVYSSPDSVAINSLKEIEVSMAIDLNKEEPEETEDLEDAQPSDDTQTSENTELAEDTESAENTENPEDTASSSSYYAKVMLIDDLNNIIPLFEVKEI